MKCPDHDHGAVIELSELGGDVKTSSVQDTLARDLRKYEGKDISSNASID